MRPKPVLSHKLMWNEQGGSMSWRFAACEGKRSRWRVERRWKSFCKSFMQPWILSASTST